MRELRAAMVFAILTVACGSIACGQSSNAQKLASLDEALKAGVITQDEYDAKAAQLKGGGQVDPAKKAALDEAFKSGVLSQQEYDAKIAALKGSAPSAPAGSPSSTAATSDGGSKGGKKTYGVVDTVMGMGAFKVTVPADWTFDGAVLRSSCGDGLPKLVYRAFSADKLTGAQLMPQADWYSAADERAYKMSGIKPCNLHAPARAADVAAKIATDLRSGAQVVALPPPTPQMTENLQKLKDSAAEQLAAANAKYPPAFQMKWEYDSQRVQLRYDFEGHPVEEMLVVFLNTNDSPVSVIGSGPNGIIKPEVARLIHTVVSVSGVRAPAGKLEATLAAVNKDISVEMVKDWDDAMIALINENGRKANAMIQANGQAALERGRQFGEQMQARNDQFHAWQQQQGEHSRAQFAEDMRQKDARSANFLDYVKDQTYYLNPSTGQTATIKNIPGVSGFVGETPSGNWVDLIPIHH